MLALFRTAAVLLLLLAMASGTPTRANHLHAHPSYQTQPINDITTAIGTNRSSTCHRTAFIGKRIALCDKYIDHTSDVNQRCRKVAQFKSCLMELIRETNCTDKDFLVEQLLHLKDFFVLNGRTCLQQQTETEVPKLSPCSGFRVWLSQLKCAAKFTKDTKAISTEDELRRPYLCKALSKYYSCSNLRVSRKKCGLSEKLIQGARYFPHLITSKYRGLCSKQLHLKTLPKLLGAQHKMALQQSKNEDYCDKAEEAIERLFYCGLRFNEVASRPGVSKDRICDELTKLNSCVNETIEMCKQSRSYKQHTVHLLHTVYDIYAAFCNGTVLVSADVTGRPVETPSVPGGAVTYPGGTFPPDWTGTYPPGHTVPTGMDWVFSPGYTGTIPPGWTFPPDWTGTYPPGYTGPTGTNWIFSPGYTGTLPPGWTFPADWTGTYPPDYTGPTGTNWIFSPGYTGTLPPGWTFPADWTGTYPPDYTGPTGTNWIFSPGYTGTLPPGWTFPADWTGTYPPDYTGPKGTNWIFSPGYTGTLPPGWTFPPNWTGGYPPDYTTPSRPGPYPPGPEPHPPGPGPHPPGPGPHPPGPYPTAPYPPGPHPPGPHPPGPRPPGPNPTNTLPAIPTPHPDQTKPGISITADDTGCSRDVFLQKWFECGLLYVFKVREELLRTKAETSANICELDNEYRDCTKKAKMANKCDRFTMLDKQLNYIQEQTIAFEAKNCVKFHMKRDISPRIEVHAAQVICEVRDYLSNYFSCGNEFLTGVVFVGKTLHPDQVCALYARFMRCLALLSECYMQTDVTPATNHFTKVITEGYDTQCASVKNNGTCDVIVIMLRWFSCGVTYYSALFEFAPTYMTAGDKFCRISDDWNNCTRQAVFSVQCPSLKPLLDAAREVQRTLIQWHERQCTLIRARWRRLNFGFQKKSPGNLQEERTCDEAKAVRRLLLCGTGFHRITSALQQASASQDQLCVMVKEMNFCVNSAARETFCSKSPFLLAEFNVIQKNLIGNQEERCKTLEAKIGRLQKFPMKQQMFVNDVKSCELKEIVSEWERCDEIMKTNSLPFNSNLHKSRGKYLQLESASHETLCKELLSHEKCVNSSMARHHCELLQTDARTLNRELFNQLKLDHCSQSVAKAVKQTISLATLLPTLFIFYAFY